MNAAQANEQRVLAALADEAEARAYADMYAAAPEALRSRLGLQVQRHAGARLLQAPGLPASMLNRVIGLGLHQPAQDGDIDALIDRFRASGGKPWWVHASPFAAPADLADRLLQRGFGVPARRAWAKVWRGPSPAPVVATDLAIGPATTADLGEAMACVAQAFGMPPFMADWLAALHGRTGWQVYSIRDGSQPVGGGALFIDGDMAWLGMGAVLPSHRRRGGQGALMARRIADAIAAGCQHIITETGEPIGDEPNPSLANMFRCGFVAVASRLNFEAPPA